MNVHLYTVPITLNEWDMSSSELTLQNEQIMETIVISSDADGQAHIAPFGIREREGYIVIMPFRPSTTLDNLVQQGVATVNFTDDVRVFAGALTGRRQWPVISGQLANTFYLENTLSHRELILHHIEEDAIRPSLYFETYREVNHRAFAGFNRAQAAVIELAVLVSRLDRLPEKKIKEEMAYLEIAISKTAGPREWTAWHWLAERVENTLAERNGATQA